jgi:hypothetical protein
MSLLSFLAIWYKGIALGSALGLVSGLSSALVLGKERDSND